MFTDNTTSQMLYSVRKCLDNNLQKKYKIDNDETVNELLKIHGISKDNFDFIKNIEKVINERLNDISIDENSNKNMKSIEGINNEEAASIKKIIGLDYLYKSMKVLYGKDEATRLMGELLDLSLGLADSTQILKPYCYSIDASKIVTIGRDFGQLYSKPSKRVSSYIAALNETVHQMSSHLAGAIAIGTFFLDISHLYLFKEKKDLTDLKTSKKMRKELENLYQNFIHSVNHLSRNGIESPFTNVSIFDRIKLETIIKEMDWYFPIDKLPIDIPKDIDTEEDKKKFCIDYVIDFVSEVQNVFLDFFDQGDPNKGGMPYRFPICTLNISKKKWGDKYIIADEKFLKFVCKRDIYRYNIYVSEGTKLASCCRLISDSEMLNYASAANSFGGAGISLGSHRVCTINFNRIALESKTKEEFFELLDQRTESALKILRAHKDLLRQLEKKGLQLFITKGWINFNRLFSTVGIMGIYEATKLYKEKFPDCKKKDIEGEMLIFLNNKVKEYSTKYQLVGNIEQIPGESFAIRLAKADKLLFKGQVPFVLYSNQFVPLWEDASLWEKMDIDGKYNKLITGGGIVHCQIGEKVTQNQAEKIIKYAVNSGAEHFALNAVYSICEDNHTTFGKHETCPECSKKIVDCFTRIVGFFTPLSSWVKERREWEFPKRTFIKFEEDN